MDGESSGVLPTDLNYTFEEFRLLCAQMVQPSGQLMGSRRDSDNDQSDPSPASSAQCVSVCLSHLITTTSTAWRKSVQRDMGLSIRRSLEKDFPIRDILPHHGGESSRVGMEFLLRPLFKKWWRERCVDLNNEDGGEERGAGEWCVLMCCMLKYLCIVSCMFDMVLYL